MARPSTAGHRPMRSSSVPSNVPAPQQLSEAELIVLAERMQRDLDIRTR